MSMKSLGCLLVTALLASSLIGCDQHGQTPVASPSEATTSQPSEVSSHSVSGANLVVRPASVDGCKPDQPIVAAVSWHSLVPKVKVMVAGPGEAATRLFSESGYTGSAKTGDWVVANTRFELVDAKTGQILATEIVTATKCN